MDMNCPACDSDRVYRSRPRGARDHIVKLLLPVSYYRCHACGWRKARFRRLTVKGATMNTLSLAGYIGGVGLVLGAIAGVVVLTLTFLGVTMPWSR